MRVAIMIAALCCLSMWLGGCGQSNNGKSLVPLQAPGNLDAIRSRGELVIVTRNAPTVWYIDRDGRSSGPEHDLAAAFARALDVTPRFVVLDSVQAMLNAVAAGKADMAAGAITRTIPRKRRFDFGPPYARVWQDVVCNNRNKPRKPADLAQVRKLVVAADTSYAERLTQLANAHPNLGLQWHEAEDVGTEELLARVADDKIGCTVADSNIVAINRRYHPSLLVMFRLSKAQHLAWPMPKGSDKLRAAADKWLQQYKASGKLDALKERYYGFVRKWDYVDKKVLVDSIGKVYPRYDALFTRAANRYDFDKWLLAAQAWQESHWNPDATSPTGVRGMMMLTRTTARALGVADRLDPEQSIMGGASYLREMEQQLPDDIAPPQRYYFALAAYNIGYYHLRDAMTLARRQGLDPHRWADVRKTLPLLMRKRYYSTVPYGYARGTEAVTYVQRIRDYSDIIRHVIEDRS